MLHVFLLCLLHLQLVVAFAAWQVAFHPRQQPNFLPFGLFLWGLLCTGPSWHTGITPHSALTICSSSAWGWSGISALSFHKLHFSTVRSNSSDPGQVKSPTRECHKSKFLMAALSLAPNIWSLVVKLSDDATASWQLQDSMTLCQK